MQVVPPDIAAAAAASGADGSTDEPILGSGVPPEERRRRKKPGEPESIFELDEKEMLKRGEATVEWITSTYTRLCTEGSDMRRGAVSLSTVAASFPRMLEALGDVGVGAENVEGVWVVPPFILKDLPPVMRWHDVRGRLGPFLKNDVWRRIDAEVRAGRAVDWSTMGLQPENVVVVRHRWPWKALALAAAKQLTWTNLKRWARDAYAAATRERLGALLVRLWPFQWLWLAGWLLVDATIWLSYKATASVVPISWLDMVQLALANFMVLGYALRMRTEVDAILADADSFKTAGSVALKRGNLQVWDIGFRWLPMASDGFRWLLEGIW